MIQNLGVISNDRAERPHLQVGKDATYHHVAGIGQVISVCNLQVQALDGWFYPIQIIRRFVAVASRVYLVTAYAFIQ